MKALRLRTLSVPPLLFDAVLAAILGGVGAAQLLSRRNLFDNRIERPPFSGNFNFPGGGTPPPRLPEPDLFTYGLLGFCAGSLVVRSRYPLLSLAGVTLFGAAYLLQSQPVFAVQLIVLVAVYSAVADSTFPRTAAVLISLLVGAVLGAAIYVSDAPRTNAQWAMDAAWLLAAIFLGDSVRSRREIAAQSEKSREEEALRRVSEERLQIARELHDVVGHNISLINVQAGAGSHVLYKDADQARETFNNIRTASHETLQELRSLVGVLRDPATGESRTPTTGLEELAHLIKGFVDAGQNVKLRVTGNRRNLPGIVDLSAYRIVQEALTNAIRHAPDSAITVSVHYGDDSVSLRVINDRGSQIALTESTGDGHGLQGMRERVLAIGGQLDAGPDLDGGFHVLATLPLT
jgi:signal transduction histidine kinase